MSLLMHAYTNLRSGYICITVLSYWHIFWLSVPNDDTQNEKRTLTHTHACIAWHRKNGYMFAKNRATKCENRQYMIVERIGENQRGNDNVIAWFWIRCVHTLNSASYDAIRSTWCAKLCRALSWNSYIESVYRVTAWKCSSSILAKC